MFRWLLEFVCLRHCGRGLNLVDQKNAIKLAQACHSTSIISGRFDPENKPGMDFSGQTN